MTTNRYSNLTIDELQSIKWDIEAIALPLIDFEWLYFQAGMREAYQSVAADIDQLEAWWNEADAAEYSIRLAEIEYALAGQS